jgi:hypothetical protein
MLHPTFWNLASPPAGSREHVSKPTATELGVARVMERARLLYERRAIHGLAVLGGPPPAARPSGLA